MSVFIHPELAYRGMGIGGLDKTASAPEELRRKGLAD
jgi:hypothetical protein